MALAKKNIKGYPSALLMDSVSSGRNEVAMDKAKVAELLESSDVRTAVTKAALEYSAQVCQFNQIINFLRFSQRNVNLIPLK